MTFTFLCFYDIYISTINTNIILNCVNNSTQLCKIFTKIYRLMLCTMKELKKSE